MTASFYGTVDGFKAWADDRGVAYAGKTDDQITQALVRSTDYIDATYRDAFLGLRTEGRAQALEWPRAGAIDINGYGIPITEIPVEVLNATYEGVVRELAAPGSLSPDIKAGGGLLKSVKAGPVTIEYATSGSNTAVFQRIDNALGSLLVVPSAYSGAVSRA